MARRVLKVRSLAADDIDPPPRGLLQHYLELAYPHGGQAEGPADYAMSELTQVLSGSNAAKQVAHQWTRHRLAVRLRHGFYALVDPALAIRTWALPAYYADLLTQHDVLARHEIPHAFACLTAGSQADYVPERPWLVIPHAHARETSGLEAIYYDYAKAFPVGIRAMSMDLQVPALAPADAAVVLAASGLPREVKASRKLAVLHPVTRRIAEHLNAFGIRTRDDVHTSNDPQVRLPAFLSEQRHALADALVREARQ